MSSLISSSPRADSSDGREALLSLLKANALAGQDHRPLVGRHIGVVCDDPLRPEVFLLERIASGLGARVALVRPGLHSVTTPLAGEQTGRMLGLLYDALICVDVPVPVVQVYRESSGIPASADLAGEWLALASRLDAGNDERALLQALVIEACA